jgi:hypothetical protein
MALERREHRYAMRAIKARVGRALKCFGLAKRQPTGKREWEYTLEEKIERAAAIQAYYEEKMEEHMSKGFHYDEEGRLCLFPIPEVVEDDVTVAEIAEEKPDCPPVPLVEYRDYPRPATLSTLQEKMLYLFFFVLVIHYLFGWRPFILLMNLARFGVCLTCRVMSRDQSSLG